MPSGLFAACVPFREHRLAVGDGHLLAVEESGSPDGIPVVFLHGGPGSCCSSEHRRFFDPARFRAVLFDQRGCGQSAPLGGLHANTTAHLLADIEQIRQTLGIERWLVFGGSWGSLLALAYARQHPAHVSGLILRGIFLGSADELQRYAQGLDQMAPEAWQRLAAGVPASERGHLLHAYTRRLLDNELAVRQSAARHWIDYERALMGEAPLTAVPDARQLAKTAVQAHYLAQSCFIDSAGLLADCSNFRHLPAIIVQGSDDPVCPPVAAERLHRAWPEAKLQIVPGGRHSALAPDMAAACIAALNTLADQITL